MIPRPEIPGWMKSQSESFDRVAEAYDHYRPGYPTALIDYIIHTSGLPRTGKILEVGSGTGKATLPFARRGYTIHCVDPGGNLIRIAKQNLKEFHKVTFEVANFETWHPSGPTYHLVISAQAWHWLDPQISYPKAATVLLPGGCLAIFWNMSTQPETPAFLEIQQAYQRIVPEMTGRVSYNEKDISDRKIEMESSGYFDDVKVWRYRWAKRYSEQEYLGLLGTYSDHIALPDSIREELYIAIAQAIRANGGYIDRPMVATVFTGIKKGKG